MKRIGLFISLLIITFCRLQAESISIELIDTIYTDSTYKVRIKTTTQEGILTDTKTFDLKHNLLSSYKVLDGNLHGIMYNWYNDGSVMDTISYKHGVQHGYWVSYYKSGEKLSEGDYIDGEGTIITYYKSGNVKSKEPTAKGGLPTDYWEYWCENGQLIKRVDWTKEKYFLNTFYCNGKIKETGFIYNKFPDESWKYYLESGKLIKEEVWDKGTLVSTKEY